jgi:hypothetical protein
MQPYVATEDANAMAHNAGSETIILDVNLVDRLMADTAPVPSALEKNISPIRTVPDKPGPKGNRGRRRRAWRAQQAELTRQEEKARIAAEIDPVFSTPSIIRLKRDAYGEQYSLKATNPGLFRQHPSRIKRSTG